MSETVELNVTEKTWQTFKSALEGLLSEVVPAGAGGGTSDEDLKRVVTEAVGAVLLESNVFEKVLARSFQKLSDETRKRLTDVLVPRDAMRKICEEAFRSMTLHHLVPALQKQVTEKINSQLLDIGKSEEFKSLIDSRFRMMEQYLRTDVIPKVVEKSLTERQV